MCTATATATLLEAARRASRGGVPRIVLKLHLSHIPGLRPHHGRIARAILLDVAQRLDGEVMRLPDGDLALLSRYDPKDQIGPAGTGPGALPSVLEQLFAASMPEDSPLFTIWRLPGEASAMARALGGQPVAPPPLPPTPANPLAAVGALLDFPAVPDLLRRQTAIRLRPQDRVHPFTASFRELTFSIDALEARSALPGQAQTDPFVFRHLAARLDDRMLSTLYRQLQAGGPSAALNQDRAAAVPLHINLALPSILSSPFEQLAALARRLRIALGVELSYVEAAAAPAAFAVARARLQGSGASVILDGVSPAALRMTRPGHLGADLLKLDWAPSLSRPVGDVGGGLQEAIQGVGPDRIVLHRAESEAALAWGLAQGITQFQGRYVDAMLAAARATDCIHAQACSLRQCIDRAAAIGTAGRAECQAPMLLEGPPSAAALSA